MSEPVMMKRTVSRRGVVATVSIAAPADAFRGELVVALDAVVRNMQKAIDERYAGGGSR